LLERFPARKKSRAYRTRGFLAATADVLKLRDGVQHLDERVVTLAEENRPAWGSLSWVAKLNPGDSVAHVHTLVAGTIFDSEHRLINPLGEVIHPPVDLITLDAFGLSVSLSNVIASMERITRVWELFLAGFGNRENVAGADAWISVEIEFKEEPEPESR